MEAGKHVFMEKPVTADGPTSRRMLELAAPTDATVLLRGEKLGFEGEVLEPGIRDLNGIGMAANFRFSFATRDSTPPKLT